MTRHLSKLLDATWYICMGLFLGLNAGLVLAVIFTFRGARFMEATPGLSPFDDPRFSAYHSDAVAGHIGQNLFTYGGLIAQSMLWLAAAAWFAHSLVVAKHAGAITGIQWASRVRFIALLGCCLLMLWAGILTKTMNNSWTDLYDTTASDTALAERRDAFDALHHRSERVTTSAWLCGLVALSISPWCRRPSEVPLQSGDGEEENS